MKTSSEGISILKDIENPAGVALKPFRDSTGYSVGWSHFIQEGEEYLMNGVTKEQADALLEKDLRECEAIVNSRIRVPLRQNQFDALVILTYNIESAIQGGSLDDLINAGASEEAISSKWKEYHFTHDANNQLISSPYLVQRRQREVNLYFGGGTPSLNGKQIIAAAITFFIIILIVKFT